MRQVYYFLCLLLVSYTSNAQTYNINTSNTPPSGGTCDNPGIDGTFDCAVDGGPAIDLGSFTDTNSAGSQLQSITLVIYGACSGDVEFFLNGVLLVSGTTTGPDCTCAAIADDPTIPQNYGVTVTPAIAAAFVAGGANTLSVAVDNSVSNRGAQCFYGADVTIVTGVSFTALSDLCIDAGVQSGLGGGIPQGGIYSGTGVTDDGNGMTYSFDPVTAGSGTTTISYMFSGETASDAVEVFDLPTIAFTAPTDLCIDAGEQTGLGGATPTGGVYSGSGVTDDGDGMTYSFDPSVAGTGSTTITYSFTDGNGCSQTANDVVEVFELPTVTFTALADLCVDAGEQSGLGGATPVGGIYSGSGVTDDGNGTTYSFDPSVAGNGTTTITYSFTDGNGCSQTANDAVEVFGLPTLTFTALADLCIDAGEQSGLGGATPSGGVYSGSGVTDDGNGTTYSFDPSVAGNGTTTITYSFTDGNGCSQTASDTVEVFELPTVTYTAPADLCLDAGAQSGLGGATPVGGIYSGAGVTDDGNGMTYSFDPSVAGTGITTITYNYTDGNGCSQVATDTIEVFELPTVSFTALADLCVDAGIQSGLGGSSPSGGVYSGSGVTDDGNGMTYSFDPSVAGAGTTTITYSFTNGNGCLQAASDVVEVFGLPTVTFTALADLCVDAGVQSGLGGATPSGGMYSGSGVMDDGNGMTYSFNPSVAGAGTTTVSYSFINGNGCTQTASDTVEVFELPTVTFTAVTDLCIDAGVQFGLGGGIPTGGIYSGTGVTNNGNGTTYSFDPSVAGIGSTTITYSFIDGNGCSQVVSDTVEIFEIPTVTFTAMADLCIDAGEQTGLGGGTPVGGVYSGAGVTDDGNGSTYSFNPSAVGTATTIITYSFTDGNGCSLAASDAVEVFGVPDASVDDSQAPTFMATNNGATYQWVNCDTNMEIPGENNQSFTATGNGNYAVDITENGCTMRSSCFSVNTLQVSDIVAETNALEVYPNPTRGIVQISSKVVKVSLYSVTGQKSFETNKAIFDISELQPGLYFMNIETPQGGMLIKRLIKI